MINCNNVTAKVRINRFQKHSCQPNKQGAIFSGSFIIRPREPKQATTAGILFGRIYLVKNLKHLPSGPIFSEAL